MSAVTSRASRSTILALFASLTMIAAGLFGVAAAPAASAAGNPNSPGQSGEHKITICHRTNSTTNPYVSITVDQDAADGNLGNDKGQGDHYMEHTGPVWNSSMRSGGDWGDIIPPITDVHAGRNWDAAGQAIYNNGCKVPTFTSTKTAGGTTDYCLNGVDGSYTYFGSGQATSNISQADADAKAQLAADAAAATDKTAKLPTGATNGKCTVYTSTKTTSGNATYCLNSVEDSYTYEGSGTATSTVSQTDADTKAKSLADSNAQTDKTSKLPAGATPGACGTASYTSFKTAGGTVTYCLAGAEGSYAYFGSGEATSSESQAKADELAQKAADDAATADKAAKLPSGAAEGRCQVFTATRTADGSVTYCLNGSTGSFDYAGEATETSTVSQDEANTRAQAAADAEAEADRTAKLPSGAVEGSCRPNPPTPPAPPVTPVTPTVVEPAVVEPVLVVAPVAAPAEAIAPSAPATVAVPAAATIPVAVPAGGGSSAPGFPAWAVALLMAGAIGAVVAGARFGRASK